MDDLTLTFDTSRFDIDLIHAVLAESYWSSGIPRDVVEKAIAGSLCVAAFSGGQIGFARLVTDRATFAYLADVFVLPDHRAKGVARRMLEALFAHPDVQGLRRMLLATRDAHGLYEKFGFTQLGSPSRFMELHRPDVYSSSRSD
jgi:GNAT superfamily N-acetyltransferase